MVHVCYQWNEEYLENSKFRSLKLFTEYNYFISDDKNHDVLFVKSCFNMHWKHITNCGLYFN